MSYITTITGKHIDFANITPDQFCIKDIAAGLSNTCRFTGQLANFYSVAQHSVYVSQIVPPEYALEALLHDATEAYMGDITSPLKAMLPDYKAIEKRVDAAIREKFGLPPVMTIDVHHADLVMLATERRDFEISPGCGFPELAAIDPHDDIIIQPLTPPQAYHQFMARFELLISNRSVAVSYIKPERDEYGYWSHPDIPYMETPGEVKAWLSENNLEYHYLPIEDDIDCDNPAWAAYFDNGNPNVSAWEPTPPDGDGWIMIWICDSYDGACCAWVRDKKMAMECA